MSDTTTTAQGSTFLASRVWRTTTNPTSSPRYRPVDKERGGTIDEADRDRSARHLTQRAAELRERGDIIGAIEREGMVARLKGTEQAS